jgi:hypothetical protein
MLKKFVAAAAIVLLFASPVCSEQLISNGDFETGDLTGWERVKIFAYQQDNDFHANDEDVASGLFNGHTSWNYQIRQTINPTPVVDIESASISAKTGRVAHTAVRFNYESNYEIMVLETNSEWGTFDLKPFLQEDKTLVSIEISGYEGNGDTNTWYDDVSVTTIEEEEVVAEAWMDDDIGSDSTGYEEEVVEEEVVEEPVEEPEVIEIIVEVSTCDNINYDSMNKKARNKARLYCKHMNKWQERLAKITEDGVIVDNTKKKKSKKNRSTDLDKGQHRAALNQARNGLIFF